MLRKEKSGREHGRPESRRATEDPLLSDQAVITRLLLHSPKVEYIVNRVDGQKRSNQWRVVVTTRYEGGIQGFRLSKANETDLYRPVHLYSRHFWPYLAFSRSFLNEGRSFFFFPFPPSPRGKITFLFRSATAAGRTRHLCFPLYHFVTSLSLSLSTLLSFYPLALSPPSHRRIRPHFYSLWSLWSVCTPGKKKKNEHGMESLATHPWLILLFFLSLSL